MLQLKVMFADQVRIQELKKVPARVCIMKYHPSTRKLLDLFCGLGSLSQSARSHGWQSRAIDILNGPEQDLRSQKLQQELVMEVKSNEYTWVHMGPPCTTFTFWYRFTSSKNTRTATCPEGLGLSDAERLGNEMASFCAKLANLCIQQGVWFTIEQPRASLMWALADFHNIINHPPTRTCHLVMCQYGSPTRRRQVV